MIGLHRTVTIHEYFTGDLVFFTTGLLLAAVLLVLTLRAAKLPGTPVANIMFAVCSLLWTAGGLAHVAFLVSGLSRESYPALLAHAVQFSGAAALPIPILAIWRPYAVLAWQKSAARAVEVFACISAAAISLLLWSAAVSGAGLVPFGRLKDFIAYNAAILLVLGAVTSLRRDSTPRAVYLPSLAMIFAACGASIMLTVARNRPPDIRFGDWFAFMASHLLLLLALCAFFLFARFRFADVFIRYGVRILLAGVWASLLAFTMRSKHLADLAGHSPSPWAIQIFGVVIVANALLLSFTFIDDRISRLVNRWLFRATDYRAATRQLSIALSSLSLESEIADAVEIAARTALELSGARLIPVETLPRGAVLPAGVLDGEIVELDHTDPLRGILPLVNVEVLVPVSSAGHVTHLLLVSPGSGRPGIVMQDLNYLRMVAVQCGNRLDALGRERDAIERQSQEAHLLQQVTEAELRALRAQINPHFLFNSLNTIADLIVRDPPRAEDMTLRLASAFRHVLQNSSRALTSIRDEIEFLRTYLYIEEARFRDRLHVEIGIDPEVAGEQIPSLILQPLVENALKHGLGPKPGPVRLWISARALGNHVRLTVKDDGMGPGVGAGGKSAATAGLTSGSKSGMEPNGRAAAVADAMESSGLGLANVRERLRTLYGDKASVSLQPREGGGTLVTVLIPRVEVSSGTAEVSRR